MENINNKIQVTQITTTKSKRITFNLKYSPLYINNNVTIHIYNDHSSTLIFEFKGEQHFKVTFNSELYQDDKKLIDFVAAEIIKYEKARIKEVQRVE